MINNTKTRIDAVMQEIASRIASRSYVPGARLPSVRAQAKTMRMSVSTVVEAYERLAAEGLVVARPGSGFYVTGPVAPLALTEIEPKRDREIDPLWVSRQSLDAAGTVLRPGCGWLPPDWMFEEGIRRALRTVSRAGNSVLTEYSDPRGHAGLRQLIARRLAQNGVETVPNGVLLTDSGTNAIDLICRFLLQPGDCVLVDDPCYFNFHAILKAHRVKAIGVPYTPQGPDIDAFGEALRNHSPRLYITNSGIHNPTGAVLSPVVAHRLLKLADSTDLVIVEDDIFADFEQNPAPRLAAFDGLSRVIQIGSFSKTVSASVRCGYIVTKSEWIEKLADLKIATGFGSGRLSAEILFAALTDSAYRKHLETIRLRLSKAMVNTIERLSTLGISPWIVPESGMFLWCILPEGMEAAAIARACIEDNVILAPGNVFSQSLSAGGFMRLNVAQCSEERVFDTIRRALTYP